MPEVGVVSRLKNGTTKSQLNFQPVPLLFYRVAEVRPVSGIILKRNFVFRGKRYRRESLSIRLILRPTSDLRQR